MRWVTDSEKFNEWMNPIDYETEESVEEQEAIAKANGTVSKLRHCMLCHTVTGSNVHMPVYLCIA